MLRRAFALFVIVVCLSDLARAYPNLCPTDAHWNGTVCVGNLRNYKTFQYNSTVHVRCPLETSYIKGTMCVTLKAAQTGVICPLSSSLFNGKCWACPIGYTFTSGRCLSLQPLCPQEYYFYNGYCILIGSQLDSRESMTINPPIIVPDVPVPTTAKVQPQLPTSTPTPPTVNVSLPSTTTTTTTTAKTPTTPATTSTAKTPTTPATTTTAKTSTTPATTSTTKTPTTPATTSTTKPKDCVKIAPKENADTEEKCCTIVTPRQCQLQINLWNCTHRRYNRCGDFCTTDLIYLTPRKVTYKEPVLVMPPPKFFSRSNRQSDEKDIDCSGCTVGGYHCSPQCYLYDCDNCQFQDHKDFCKSYGGAGCDVEDGLVA